MVSEIIKLIEKGKIEEVLNKVNEIKGDANLEIIALSLIDKGYLEEAEKIAENIYSVGLRDEVLRKIAIKYIEKGDVEKALSIAEKIRTETDLEKIAMKFTDYGYYRDALKVAEKIRSRAIKEEVLMYLINKLLKELGK